MAHEGAPCKMRNMGNESAIIAAPWSGRVQYSSQTKNSSYDKTHSFLFSSAAVAVVVAFYCVRRFVLALDPPAFSQLRPRLLVHYCDLRIIILRPSNTLLSFSFCARWTGYFTLISPCLPRFMTLRLPSSCVPHPTVRMIQEGPRSAGWGES